MPIPQNPVYVPPELMNLLLPPPPSGLPFNAQLHESDVERGYVVPAHYPQPLMADLESEVEHNPDLRAVKEAHEEFMKVLRRSIVRVVPPSDRTMLDLIHKTIEYVIKEGPVFEAIIIARENKNFDYRFLWDNKCYEHIYYRWKLFSILNGDDPYNWRIEKFRMFEDGPLWKPPPLNPFADGMPVELINSLAGEALKTSDSMKLSSESGKSGSKPTGTLDQMQRDRIASMLRDLDPKKVKIGALMVFCIDHAHAAKEIIDLIEESLRSPEIQNHNNKVARLFLISDILNNCSAAVTNASFYREGFQTKLVGIFESLRQNLVKIVDSQEADVFKHKVLTVLGAWREWTLYENEFLVRLSDILLGIESHHHDKIPPLSEIELPKDQPPKVDDSNIDGVDVDEKTLSKCLESKGLSLRWYMTLELSEDEDDEIDLGSLAADEAEARVAAGASSSPQSSERVRFKSSKWETLDPSEVAGQAVTISKWEAMARAEEEEGITDSSPDYDERSEEGRESNQINRSANKRMKMTEGNSSSSAAASSSSSSMAGDA